MNPDAFDDLTDRIRTLFTRTPAADLQKNMRTLLTSFLARLDLVPRDEFDVQRQVLLRTREKLELLEARVAELEQGGRPASESALPPIGRAGPRAE